MRDVTDIADVKTRFLAHLTLAKGMSQNTALAYGDDVDKTRRRAEGDFSEVWGAMCKRDDRMIQTVTLSTVEGFLIDHKTTGQFSE